MSMALQGTPTEFFEPTPELCSLRFRRGEWRALIFRDLVFNEIVNRDGSASVLDIGCGRGFDDDLRIQEQIGEKAS
jgi:hypothetical protein